MFFCGDFLVKAPAVAFSICLVGLCASFAQLRAALAQDEPSKSSAEKHLSEFATYRASPWAPKWISLGGYEDVHVLRRALDSVNVKVGLGANKILGNSAFVLSRTKKDVTLTIATVADLGFGDEGASLSAIYIRARQLGVELCPAELGPLLRLRYLSQPVGEWLHIGMTPIPTGADSLLDFTVANGGTGPMLLGGNAKPDLLMPSQIKFVFILPPSLNAVSSGPVDAARARRSVSP